MTTDPRDMVPDGAEDDGRLRQTAPQWCDLLQHAPDGYCVIEQLDTTPADFRIVEANPAFASETGIDDGVGQTVRGVFGENRDDWIATFHAILETRAPLSLEPDAPARDRILEVMAFPLGQPALRRLGVRVKNVTERVRVRQRDRQEMARSAALAEALEAARRTADADADRLNLALDAARLGDWSWDAKTDIVTLSARAADIYGIRPGPRLTWTALRDLLHADDRERARRAAETAIASKTDYGIEHRVVSDGRERWIAASGRARYDEHGDVLGMFGVVQDLTADRLLVRLDDAVRQLAEPAEITYAAARMLGTHLRVSRCAYATVEADEDTFDLTGNYTSGTHSIVGRYRFRQFGAECLAVMRAGLPYVVSDSEHDSRIDDEDLAAYRMTAIRAVVWVPIRKSGRFVAAMAVHDTHRRAWAPEEVALVQQVASRCWESIERARIELERVNLLALAENANRAKDEFMAMLGHELRNPLSPILTALQLMKLRGDRTFERERTVIARQVTHLTRLVDDLLDVSRIARGKVTLAMEPVPIAEVVARAIEIASPLLEQGAHTLTVDVAQTGLTVFGDPARLAQVMSNLLTNASKYTPANGRIDVSARREGPDVVLRVRDTGMGIAADVLPRIFDLFVQGHQSIERSNGGLGLGLSIVQSLVDRHRGRVTVHSDGPGFGSEFVVYLPAIQETEPAPDRAAEEVDHSPRGRGAVLLVVDDNQDAATLLAEALRLLGHEVHVAHDGLEALRIVPAHAFDAAFLDIGLPVMDGYELAIRLRTLPSSRATRLIAVTGYGQPSDRQRSGEAGFDEHLVKPIDLGLVERLLRQYVAE
ncbi:MAG: ATP-binding protein [Vicinamibacterales bacterium]